MKQFRNYDFASKKIKTSFLFLLIFQLALFAVHAQTKITGAVKDEKGLALPSTTVTVKGTDIYTLADAEGKYSISVPDKKAVLVFSFVNHTNVEETVEVVAPLMSFSIPEQVLWKM